MTKSNPKPSERKWYRSTVTGDRGYAAERDGRDVVILDQPGHEVVRKLNGEWQPEHERPPLSAAQVGMICFNADAAYCRIMGIRSGDHGGWESLSDEQRIAWMDTGPKTGKRRKIYAALRKILTERDGEGQESAS